MFCKCGESPVLLFREATETPLVGRLLISAPSTKRRIETDEKFPPHI